MPEAARLSDEHDCSAVDPGPSPHVGGPILPECEPTVLIEDLPAARVSDLLKCIGGAEPDVIMEGSPTVWIGDMMAARLGDMTLHGGTIIEGALTVIIGDGGLSSATMSAAKLMGAPLAQVCGGLAGGAVSGSGSSGGAGGGSSLA